MDMGQREVRPVEVRVFVRTDARRAACAAGDAVLERQNNLIAVAVGRRTCAEVRNIIEPEAHRIRAGHKVSDLAAETEAPIFIGCAPLLEAPVIAHAGSAADALAS